MEPSTEELVAVVVGNFNPAIFHPAWLADRQLIPRTAADNAEVALVHPALAQFRCNDLTLYVDKDRMQISTASVAASLPLRDLAIGIFSVLEHTPISAVGINRTLHLPAGDAGDGWGALEGDLVDRASLRELLTGAVTTSLRFRGQRAGTDEGTLSITLEPSLVLPGGVYFAFNEHHGQQGGTTAASFVERVLTGHWTAAQDHFQATARGLLAGPRSPE